MWFTASSCLRSIWDTAWSFMERDISITPARDHWQRWETDAAWSASAKAIRVHCIISVGLSTAMLQHQADMRTMPASLQQASSSPAEGRQGSWLPIQHTIGCFSLPCFVLKSMVICIRWNKLHYNVSNSICKTSELWFISVIALLFFHLCFFPPAFDLHTINVLH